MGAFPKNDAQFDDSTIASVCPGKGGWWITKSDGWSFWVPEESPVEPVAGMAARTYGRGIGSIVRGLFLDGQLVFYRTEDEDREHREIEMYGRGCADVLQRWDRGDSIWSVAMGGFGPGYEQAIQLTAMEVLRWMVREKPNADDAEEWLGAMSDMAEEVQPIVEPLGLSGSQWGAACSLARGFYEKGPRDAVKCVPNDRLIQVSRDFPRLAAPTPTVPPVIDSGEHAEGCALHDPSSEPRVCDCWRGR